jgi:segregation and condensation protein B
VSNLILFTRYDLDDQQLKTAIEALLFIGGGPLSVDRLRGIFEDATKEQIEAQLQALKADYDAREAGVMVAEVANGYQLATRPEQSVWVRKFKTVKVTTRLSRPALETLAIIAYKQPVTRPEIEAIRGVNIGGIVRNLMERRLVKIVGKKDVPGKPMLYGTSVEFLQYFGLKDLSSLPTLREFQELDANEDAMVEALPERDDSTDPLQDEAAEALDAAGTAIEGAPEETAPSETARQG